jgi:hypothetical protein
MREYAYFQMGIHEDAERPKMIPIELVGMIHQLLNKIEATPKQIPPQAPTKVEPDQPAKLKKPVVIPPPELNLTALEKAQEEKINRIHDAIRNISETYGFELTKLRTMLVVKGVMSNLDARMPVEAADVGKACLASVVAHDILPCKDGSEENFRRNLWFSNLLRKLVAAELNQRTYIEMGVEEALYHSAE